MPERRALLRDEAYLALRDRIVSGDLRSGEQLEVRSLAVELGVSRTPVREALQRLEDEGLVEAAASRWTRVAVVDLARAEMVYALLVALERWAISTGMFDAGELAVMRAANERLAAAIGAGDAHAAYVADREFHNLIVAHAGNVELERIVAELRAKTRLAEHALFGGSSAAVASVAEHTVVVDALAAGDLESAAAAIEANHQQGLVRMAASVGKLNGSTAPGVATRWEETQSDGAAESRGADQRSRKRSGV